MTATDPTGHRRAGWWRRLWRRLFGAWEDATPVEEAPPPAASPPLTPISECADAGEALAVPARGDVFEFQVQIEATWSADVPDLATLRESAGRQVESVRRAVRDLIWPIGRDHLPYLAGDAEIAMSATLPPEFCFDDASTTIRCKVRLRVRPDPRALEALLPFWRRYIELDADHLLRERHADQVAALAARWRGILNDQVGVDLGDLAIPHAASLTDAQFAKAVGAMETRRNDSRNELAKVLDQAVKNNNRLGLFEFAETYEALLKAFMRHQGISEETVLGGGQ